MFIYWKQKREKSFVTITLTGYYRPDPVVEYDEDSPGGDFDFLSQLCTDWEAAAKLPNEINVRQVIIRSGQYWNIYNLPAFFWGVFESNLFLFLWTIVLLCIYF